MSWKMSDSAPLYALIIVVAGGLAVSSFAIWIYRAAQRAF